MALLEQIMIRGVRSIGTSDEDAHVIRFLNPLTIINGPNGTGKTTIIEALSFATTGALPPGKLNTFIHSMEIDKVPRVDASVKLQFTDFRKRLCVATKRMNALKKNGKLKCTSDESNIQIKCEDGTVKSISSKVADIKKEMTHLMGVPSAILENVVFCHQEDSCWPLSEPSELKNRFDRIFELTKFVKALDQLKKMKREYDTEYNLARERQKNAELKVELKARALEDRDSAESMKTEVMERMQQLKIEIAEHSQVIRDGNDRLVKMEQEERDREVKQTELRVLQQQMVNLKKVTAYIGTEAQLRREIEELSSSSEYRNLEREKDQIQRRIADIDRQIETVRREKARCEQELVKQMSAELHRQEVEGELKELMKTLKYEFGFSGGSDGEIADQLVVAISDKKTQMGKLKVEWDGDRASCQRQMESAQSECTRLECEARAASEASRRLRQELEQARTKLRATASSQTELSDLTDRIEVLEEQLKKLPVADEQLAQSIRRKRQRAQEEADRIRAECDVAAVHEEAEKERDRKETERDEANRQLDGLLEKHSPDMISLFSEVPAGPWSSMLTSMRSRSEAALEKAEDAAQTAERAADREAQTARQLDQDEQRVTDEMERLTEKIRETCACSPSEVASRLTAVRVELAAARKELAPLDTKAILYESWSSEVKQKSCCPLCERRFSSKTGIADLSTKLMNMSMSLPEETDRLQGLVADCEQKERQLASALVYTEQLSKLKTEITNVRERKVAAEARHSHESKECRTKKDELDEVKTLVQIVARVQTDVSLMDSLNVSIDRLGNDLRALSARLSSAGSTGTSYAQLKAMLTDKEEEVRQLVSESEKLQVAANEKNSLTEKLHSLREHRITLGETAAQSAHIQEQIRLKEDELAEIRRKEQEAAADLPLAKRQVERARASRDECERQTKLQEEKMMSSIRDLSGVSSRLSDLTNRLSSLSANQQDVDRHKSLIRDHELSIQSSEAKKSRCEAQLNDMDGCQVRRRTLEQQLDRLCVESQIRILEEQLSALTTQADDSKKLRSQLQKTMKSRQDAEVETGRLGGQLDEIVKKHKEAVVALRDPKMSNAEQIYRDETVMKVVCEEVIADIAKYSDCLDRSILQFHSEKMAAINEILDDLWRKVYTGGDIESIKIRSDQGSSTDKRKSYDYRVVMLVEGGIELDMRERCSAGQKMLACILIRIALADVFGGLCSIIALDEPTTNLDSVKVEHIAEMLNDLIAARRTDEVDENGVAGAGGRQFQMIVITHDSQLVEKLKMGSRPDFFYVLGKDDRGLSYVRRQFPDGHLEHTS